MCLSDHLLINFPMVLISLSAPGFMLFMLLVMSVNQFSGWGCHTLSGSLWGYCVGIYFTVGQLHAGQIIFGPSPTFQRSSIETTLKEFPSIPKLSSAWQTCDGISSVYSHCTSPENGVQAGYNVETDTQSNQCIPDAGQMGSCQQTKIPVPPWKSVPGFSCATSKWSRLIQTTLECATCCTWCDHSRWSCTSRLTVHRWCWS